MKPLDGVTYLRTGPSRLGYGVAGLLWVIGLLVAFTSAYSMEREFDDRALDYQAAAVNEKTQVRIDEAGSHTVWVDEVIAPGGSASQSADGSGPAQSPSRNLAEVAVTDSAGSPVELASEPAHEYRTVRGGKEVNGLAWGSFEARPGTYQVSVLSPNAAVVGVSVGPTPSPASIVPIVLAGIGAAVAGLVVLSVTFVRRSRVAKSFSYQQ